MLVNGKKEIKLSRAEQVKVNRLRVGHCLFSHGYMMEDIEQGPPECQKCQQATLTVKHVLLECPTVDAQRLLYFGKRMPDITEVIGEGRRLRKLFQYLRAVGIYNYI